MKTKHTEGAREALFRQRDRVEAAIRSLQNVLDGINDLALSGEPTWADVATHAHTVDCLKREELGA